MRTPQTAEVAQPTPSGEGQRGGRSRAVQQPGVRLARTLAFGDPDRETPDPGLFGPTSVSWRLHGDVIAGVGGLRAILMQGLLPEAMASIVQHSDYRKDPWGRLFRTAEYIGVITYGTTAEAERAAAIVDRKSVV